MLKLNNTFKSKVYYTNFENLPKEVQEQFRDSEVLVENSRYTVFTDMAFLRLSNVEINGRFFDLELSLGECGIENSDYNFDSDMNCYVDDDGQEIDSDLYAEQFANNIFSVIELENLNVYLTEL